MAYLVDTNVVSEICKKEPSAQVMDWLSVHANSLFLSVVTVEEMRFGELMMPEGKRRAKLGQMIDALVRSYAGKMLSFDTAAAEQCAVLHEKAISSGRTPTIEDLMIAAIAQTNGLTVATRNIRDFEYLGVLVLDPYSEPSPTEQEA